MKVSREEVSNKEENEEEKEGMTEKTRNKVRKFGEVRTKNEKTSVRNPNNGRGAEGGDEVLREKELW